MQYISVMADTALIRMLAEEGPGAGYPFEFGLQPFWSIFLVVLVIVLVWWFMRSQAGRADLHEAPAHAGDGHGHVHEDEGHTELPDAPAMAVGVESAGTVPPAPAKELEAPGKPIAASPEAVDEPRPAASEEAETSHKPENLAPDELKKIEGIGPKVAGVLNEGGILTFQQLAEASTERLNELLDAAGYQYMNPASWPEQARLAASGDWEGLKTLQDSLKGGLE